MSSTKRNCKNFLQWHVEVGDINVYRVAVEQLQSIWHFYFIFFKCSYTEISAKFELAKCNFVTGVTL